ncbi:MAG: peptidoglycan DD-metalloendopeptidase family protein [Flavobacteriaceae bacterium]|nr:peptidoglycan DD-metalloendopeptidase family protein [Flavobacteriaceae bacterium]
MRFTHTYRLLSILLLCLWSWGLQAQSSEQKALEAKRARLQKEIKEYDRLLSEEQQQKGSVLEQVEALDRKINMSQQLIRLTNQQANLLNRQINANVRKISKLREDLELLKKDYAQLIVRSYQNRSEQNRLLFLLSSSNFFQAFKRAQYLKQYAQHRKQQGDDIMATAQELSALNSGLIEQRKVKAQLIAENTRVKNGLSKEINGQKELLRSIRQNESRYAAAIDDRKKETRRIDREIKSLIRSAIASSNKKSGSSNRERFELTPEAKLIANSFTANKGKLVWPVEKGIKSQGFGVYKDKVYPGIQHRNNGVTIATDSGAEARAIFDGEVMSVETYRMGQKGIFVRHGNYISMYYNLSKVYVKKGDKVAAKEALGEIHTNRINGSTKLKFYLYEDTKRLNPEHWIYQL